MCQVKNLKSKPTDVGVGRHKRRQDLTRSDRTFASWPAERPMAVAEVGTPLVDGPLEGERVGNELRAYAMLFEESVKLQITLVHL